MYLDLNHPFPFKTVRMIFGHLGKSIRRLVLKTNGANSYRDYRENVPLVYAMTYLEDLEDLTTTTEMYLLLTPPNVLVEDYRLHGPPVSRGRLMPALKRLVVKGTADFWKFRHWGRLPLPREYVPGLEQMVLVDTFYDDREYNRLFNTDDQLYEAYQGGIPGAGGEGKLEVLVLKKLLPENTEDNFWPTVALDRELEDFQPEQVKVRANQPPQALRTFAFQAWRGFSLRS
ncbi:hypothetical protein GGR52DRAFT_573376 [Hypoxylon sp. FL1284]|nr:hypothetical protein GGR52DRAFT_573376 [Hypoxylon sp. FL1284]